MILMVLTGNIFSLFAQHNLTLSTYSEEADVMNQFGDVAYQYNRIVSRNPDNPSQVIVTFVFINGNAQTAISYRQDAVKGKIEWEPTEAGTPQKQGFVEYVTVSLPPNHVVSWKYSYTLKSIPKTKNYTIPLDKAALLIMTDNMEVTKKVFKAGEYTIR